MRGKEAPVHLTFEIHSVKGHVKTMHEFPSRASGCRHFAETEPLKSIFKALSKIFHVNYFLLPL